ncbi:MAG: Hpt domain-containing protein, partial [Clostridia bacterium]
MKEELIEQSLIEAGFDYKGSVKRFSNITAMYYKYLIKFKEDASFETALNAMKIYDLQKMYEAVHSLKGVSGNLGIDTLYFACQNVIVAIKNNSIEEIKNNMQLLTIEYNKSINI